MSQYTLRWQEAGYAHYLYVALNVGLRIRELSCKAIGADGLHDHVGTNLVDSVMELSRTPGASAGVVS